MAEEKAMGGQNMNEGVQDDVPPVRVHQLPKNLGRYYHRLLGCCVAGMFFVPFGLLGLPVWGAVAGYSIICLTCGIISLVRIRRSHGLLHGNGYVSPSILMACIMVLWLMSVLLATNVIVQSLMGSYRLFHVRNLGTVLVQYRKEHDGSLPPAEQWCDVLKETNKRVNYSFKELKDGVYSSKFALNLAAMTVVGQLPDDLVLLFETEPGWNRSGGPELLPEGDGMVRVFLAGSGAHLIRRSMVGNLRWTVNDDPAAVAAPVRVSSLMVTAITGFCGGIILVFRKYLRPQALFATGVGVLSAIAGAACGFMAESVMYSSQAEFRLGMISGGLVGLAAGVCYVLVFAFARDRMRPEVSMVGFATVAGAITGLAASTAVHVFLMIWYEDFHLMYPAAGAGFGIWAGVLLGWIGSGVVRGKEAGEAVACAA